MWPDHLPTLIPTTCPPCPQPPTTPHRCQAHPYHRVLAHSICSGQLCPSRFRSNPIQPERLTHHRGDGHPSRLCPLPAVHFPALRLCALVHSLRCNLPGDRPPTPLIHRLPEAQKTPGAQPSEHMAAVQTARHARKRSPHYEQRDAIFASSKWQSVFVIQPYFGEGVT